MTQSHRALVCERLTSDLSGMEFRQRPTPEPGAGQLLVAIRACALNFPDLLMNEGKYQFKPPMPFVPGMEASGVVVAGDPATGYKSGDKVYFGCRTGGLQERIVVDAANVYRMPDHFDFAQASAWPVGALTAFVSLVRRGQLQAGETLLVHGASGGMGMAAVQLGKYLGARVIATGSDAGKLSSVREAGADETILIPRAGGNGETFRQRVKDLTGGFGADVIYDPVGGDIFDESTRCINWGGRLLVIGFTSGRIATVPTNMILIKGFSVVGVRAGESGRRRPAEGEANRRAIGEIADSGKLIPFVGARFRFDEAMQAIYALRDRRYAGKVVVEFAP